MNALLASIPAVVCVAALTAEPTTAVRGLAAQIEVEYAPRLRARADQTPSSSIVVRISTAPSAVANRQRIEFIGAVAGNFDLRNHLEREDGKPISDLAPLPVIIVSRLPADHGVDLYATSGSWMNWRANYRELMWGAVALWAAVPVAVLVIRAARRARPAPPPAPAPPPPSVADQLLAALEAARSRPLTVEESGRLELLLFRYLGGGESTEPRDLAFVLRDLRTSDATRPLVLAIERWLHAGNGGEEARAQAVTALEELRRSRLETPQPREAAV